MTYRLEPLLANALILSRSGFSALAAAEVLLRLAGVAGPECLTLYF